MEKEDEAPEAYSPKAIANKYNINLHELEEEQEKLGETAALEDAIDFELADRIAGCDVVFIDNKIIAAIVILDKNMQIIEQQYTIKKTQFPYIPGFRAYRELPAIMECYNKLQEPFDVIFFDGHGIAHPRKCGIATHFGVVTQKPSIGVAQQLLAGEVNQGKIFMDGKIVGVELQTKEGSKPVYISPGNMISLKTTEELAKRLIIKPHKLPEPIVIARRYTNKIREEFAMEQRRVVDNN